MEKGNTKIIQQKYPCKHEQVSKYLVIIYIENNFIYFI